MKITKSTLIQMIKEEMVNEDDDPVDIPTGELDPQSIGMTLKGDLQLNLNQPDLGQREAALEVNALSDTLVDYLKNAKIGTYAASDIITMTKYKLARGQEETIEVTGEEPQSAEYPPNIASFRKTAQTSDPSLRRHLRQRRDWEKTREEE